MSFFYKIITGNRSIGAIATFARVPLRCKQETANKILAAQKGRRRGSPGSASGRVGPTREVEGLQENERGQ